MVFLFSLSIPRGVDVVDISVVNIRVFAWLGLVVAFTDLSPTCQFIGDIYVTVLFREVYVAFMTFPFPGSCQSSWASILRVVAGVDLTILFPEICTVLMNFSFAVSCQSFCTSIPRVVAGVSVIIL